MREFEGLGQLTSILFRVFECIYVSFSPSSLSTQRNSCKTEFLKLVPDFVCVFLLVTILSLLLVLEL